jgi:hypothetical protein
MFNNEVVKRKQGMRAEEEYLRWRDRNMNQFASYFNVMYTDPKPFRKIVSREHRQRMNELF